MKIKRWDINEINDGTNYVAYFLEGQTISELTEIEPVMIERTGYWPMLGQIRRPARKLTFEIGIVGSNPTTLRAQLLKWFRPIPLLTDFTGAVYKEFVIEDDDGSNDRYVEAVCRSIRAIPGTAELFYTVRLEVHRDPVWRKTSSTNLSLWTLTSGTDSEIFTINGDDIAHPVISITPRAALSGSYAHKRFIPLRWREADYGAQTYPIDICNGAFDTAAEIGAAQMQADGDDLRVFINGIERDRWLNGINTAATKVWVNFDFLPDVAMTLAEDLSGAGAIDSIRVNENISGVFTPGIVQIGSEFFQFTDKINTTNDHILTGVTRAAHGSTAAAHTTGDSVFWIQNEIYIMYGNSSVTAPVTDDRWKPILNLATSTNTSWVYADFGQTQTTGLRSASWIKGSAFGQPGFYTANHATQATTWSEIGINVTNQVTAQTGLWQLYNPCGITAANFTNGEHYATLSIASTHVVERIMGFSAGVGWQTEYTIPPPSTTGGWESWSRNQTMSVTRLAVALWLQMFRLSPLDERQIEVADVTVTLDSGKTPTTSIGAEQGAYLLDILITNINFQVDANEFSTNPGIRVKFPMELDFALIIDTYNKTVTYEKDFSSQVQAVELYPSVRRDWFPLEGGTTNTLEFMGTGTTDLDIGITYVERYLT